KFSVRYVFLNSLYGQANNIISKLDEGISKIQNFLNNLYVINIINKRKNYVGGSGNLVPNPSVSNAIIYAWRDESSIPADRLIHIVRVDARIPTKCGPIGGAGNCGLPDANGNFTSDPLWPNVKTYTKGFLDATRCYQLDNTSGVVKMRVVRFDEPHALTSLLFPNGLPIWQFRQSRTTSPTMYSDIATIKTCFQTLNPSSIIPNVPEPYFHLYQNAFLMNKESENYSCWQAANRLLEKGIVSETCAKYYFQNVSGGPDKLTGMGFNFVPCPSGTFGSASSP
ncbi:MAG TPA: hypothetical protein PKH98_06915, partial [Candidatus Omnitrophota bacterium]|nr:hypothetical protein [Candidatus Omnitrophota bacterium]